MDSEHFAEAVTIDQLRVLAAVVDHGTYSAAARALGRAQGALSYNIAQLESQLELELFAKAGRRRVLTPEGVAVLNHARDVLSEMDRLRANARGMHQGLEAQLAVVVDVLFPTAALVELVRSFTADHPTVPLSLHTAVLGEVLDALEDGGVSIGITGLIQLPKGLTQRPVGDVEMVTVVAPSHPLAAVASGVEDEEFARHVHIVIRDRSKRLTDTTSLGIETAHQWTVDDSHARLALVTAGLGWARLPLHQIRDALGCGDLIEIHPLRWAGRAITITMTSVYRNAHLPGPAGRWMLERLATLDHPDLRPRRAKPRGRARRR